MKRFWGFVVLLVIAMMVIFSFMPHKANHVQEADRTKADNFVYDRFHLRLPRDTIPLLALGDNDNFHGDGYHLLIFQLSPAGQENIMQQRYFATWSQLPVESVLQAGMTSLLQTGELTEWVDFEWTHGFYIVLSKNYGYVMNEQDNKGQKKQDSNEAFDMDEDLWRNLSFAVLDTDYQQLIIYTWDS